MSKTVLALFLIICITFAVALPFGEHNVRTYGDLLKPKRTSPVEPVIEPVITVNTGDGEYENQECSDTYHCEDVDEDNCDDMDKYFCPRTCGECETGAEGEVEEECIDTSSYCYLFDCDTDEAKRLCKESCSLC